MLSHYTIYACVCIFIFSVACSTPQEKNQGKAESLVALPSSSTILNIIIDCNSNGGPDLDIKRGRSCNISNYKKMDISKSLGFTMVSFNENMIEDEQMEDEPLDQFFIKDDGTIDVRVDDDVLNIRKYAFSENIEVIYQCTGTPYYGDGPLNAYGTKPLWPMLTKRYFYGEANWYPIPASSQDRQIFGNALAAWMKIVETKDGNDKSIWIGNQEPSHTVGFTNEKCTDIEKKENIALYIDTWCHTAKSMNSSGYKTGGIQLNGSNAPYFNDAIKELKRVSCPFDYFTIQQYKGDVSNEEILNSARKALIENQYSTYKKLLFNRYQYHATFYTSSELIKTIQAEKLLLNNADMVYAVCYEGDMFSSSLWTETFKFINQMARNRRNISLSKSGVDGFASSTSSKFSAVLWNTSSDEKVIDIKLDNYKASSNNKSLTVKIINGNNVSTSTSALWNSNLNKIEGFSIPSNGYALIQLE